MKNNYKLTAICFSCIHHSHAKVLLSSIQEYVPHDVAIYINFCDTQFTYTNHTKKIHTYNYKAKNYGDAYNFIARKAFETHEHIIVCNDDVVFCPDTFQKLQEDYNIAIDENGIENIGWIGCLTNYAIGYQNIRRNIKLEKNQEPETLNHIQNNREYCIVEANFIAPICAAINKLSWIDYLPINYFSDNLQCFEMSAQGKKHFISTAYAHHAGSMSIGNGKDEHEKAMNILMADYPQYYQMLKK